MPFLTTHKNNLKLIVQQAKDATLKFKGFNNNAYIDLLSLKDRKISKLNLPRNNLEVGNTNNISQNNTSLAANSSEGEVNVVSIKNEKPICDIPKTIVEGVCPEGTMSVKTIPKDIDDGIRLYEIEYNIPSGIQGAEHPSPGEKYEFSDNPRKCFLPISLNGSKTLIMLMQPWENRLTFSIGRSTTTQEDN